MKICIWCRSTEETKSFKKKAHTLPDSLGGNNICENVCDDCNLYFGSRQDNMPPIETVLKETFNISRAKFLSRFNQIGKNKLMPRFKSVYFDVNWEKRVVKFKSEYLFRHFFREHIARQFKRGIYKVILEEIERKNKNALDTKYDFIREFARYNLNDYPIFYFRRKLDFIFTSESDFKNPVIDWLEDQEKYGRGYLVFNHSFVEFELFGHVFGVTLSKLWHLTHEKYMVQSNELKKVFFYEGVAINSLLDIDLTLSVMNT